MADEPTCDDCGTPLVVKPDDPGIRTRWYECPECDEPRTPGVKPSPETAYCTACHAERPIDQLERREYMWAPGHYAKGQFCPFHVERKPLFEDDQ